MNNNTKRLFMLANATVNMWHLLPDSLFPKMGEEELETYGFLKLPLDFSSSLWYNYKEWGERRNPTPKI